MKKNSNKEFETTTLSGQTVAFNTQHTGDRSRDHRGYAEPFTSEQVDGLLSEDWLRRIEEIGSISFPFLCAAQR